MRQDEPETRPARLNHGSLSMNRIAGLHHAHGKSRLYRIRRHQSCVPHTVCLAFRVVRFDAPFSWLVATSRVAVRLRPKRPGMRWCVPQYISVIMIKSCDTTPAVLMPVRRAPRTAMNQKYRSRCFQNCRCSFYRNRPVLLPCHVPTLHRRCLPPPRHLVDVFIAETTSPSEYSALERTSTSTPSSNVQVQCD